MLKEEAQRTIEWRTRAELDADVAFFSEPQTDKTEGHGAYTDTATPTRPSDDIFLFFFLLLTGHASP